MVQQDTTLFNKMALWEIFNLSQLTPADIHVHLIFFVKYVASICSKWQCIVKTFAGDCPLHFPFAVMMAISPEKEGYFKHIWQTGTTN